MNSEHWRTIHIRDMYKHEYFRYVCSGVYMPYLNTFVLSRNGETGTHTHADTQRSTYTSNDRKFEFHTPLFEESSERRTDNCWSHASRSFSMRERCSSSESSVALRNHNRPDYTRAIFWVTSLRCKHNDKDRCTRRHAVPLESDHFEQNSLFLFSREDHKREITACWTPLMNGRPCSKQNTPREVVLSDDWCCFHGYYGCHWSPESC